MARRADAVTADRGRASFGGRQRRVRRYGDSGVVLLLGVMAALVLVLFCGWARAADAGVVDAGGSPSGGVSATAGTVTRTEDFGRQQRFLEKVESSDPMNLARELADLDKQKAQLQARKRLLESQQHRVQAATSERDKAQTLVTDAQTQLETLKCVDAEPPQGQPKPPDRSLDRNIQVGVLVRRVSEFQVHNENLQRATARGHASQAGLPPRARWCGNQPHPAARGSR
jgi:hypothetical protein